MIRIIQVYLLGYALLDFTCQILAQLPTFAADGCISHKEIEEDIKAHKFHWFHWERDVGFARIYHDPYPCIHEAYNYHDFILGGTHYTGMTFAWTGFVFQVMNCFMICVISL